MDCKIPDIFILSFKKVFGSKIFVTEIFSILSVQFSDIKNIYIAVQPSLISISRTFSSSPSEMLCELSNSSLLFPPLQPLATTTVLSVSMNLTLLDNSDKRNKTVFVHLLLANFMQHKVLSLHHCFRIVRISFLFKTE